MNKKRVLIIIISLIPSFIFWLGGFNFDTRGGEAVVWGCTTLLFLFTACILGGKDE